ncbi:MAG: methyltransferase domain-containing protein [Flavobacteriales bacterium]
MQWLKCLLSYAWPMPVWQGPGRYGPLQLTWESGHLVVNSGHANQSYGNLHAVWQECLSELNLRRDPPGSILILGFGAGSAATIIRQEFGLSAPITGVEGDPEMLRLARDHFRVDRFKELLLIHSDALEFVERNMDRFDLVLVDLCHELDLAPGVDEEPFIAGLRKCTMDGGILCFNTIVHDAESGSRSQLVSGSLRQQFGNVEEHCYLGINHVLVAH